MPNPEQQPIEEQRAGENEEQAEISKPVDLLEAADERQLVKLRQARRQIGVLKQQNADPARIEQLSSDLDALALKLVGHEIVGKEIEAIVDLKEQYDAQAELLSECGLVEALESGGLGIVIDGKDYPIPSYEEVVKKAQEKQAFLDKKSAQGFTKLLLVPFGVPLNHYALMMQDSIDQYVAKGLTTPDGEKVTEKVTFRMDGDGCFKNVERASRNLSYFDEAGERMEKEKMVEKYGPWQVVLVDDLDRVPEAGQGKEIEDRKQVEQFSFETEKYKSAFVDNPMYDGEVGFYPETGLIWSLSRLQQGIMPATKRGGLLLGAEYSYPTDSSISNPLIACQKMWDWEIRLQWSCAMGVHRGGRSFVKIIG